MKKHIYINTLYEIISFKLLVSIIVLLIIVQSCVKDGDFDFKKMAQNQLSPTIAAPFVNSKLSLKDIIKDTSGIIHVNFDQSLKLVYSTNNLYSIMAKDLFVIPDQSIKTDTANFNFVAPPLGDSTFYSIITPYSLQMPDTSQKQRIDIVYLKSALLKLLIETNVNHSGRIELTIPNIRNNQGDTFKIQIPNHYSPIVTPIPYTIPVNFDLSGYTIYLNNSPGHTNEITFYYKHWIYGDNNFNSISYYTHLNDSITNIQYGKLFGYIGQYDFNLKDTTFFDIFTNNTLLDNLQINNINVGVKYTNSYGLPVLVKVDKFQANSGTNTVNVHDFPVPNPFSLDYPKVSLHQVGQTINGSIPAVQSTDLANAINIAPKYIVYNVSGKSNPTGSTSEENFVLDTSKFTVAVNLELPLEGTVGGFVVQDTIDFSLDKISQIDEVTFKILTTNDFPLSADMQVYFANQICIPIDSMITTPGQQIVVSGIVDPTTRKVISPSTKMTEVYIDNTRVQKLKYAKKLIIRAKLYSYNYPNQVVKLFNDNYINVKIGMKAKFKLNP
ncbi:MAG: hypothetical protein WCL51_14990 [Bacteroidota bacterium]